VWVIGSDSETSNDGEVTRRAAVAQLDIAWEAENRAVIAAGAAILRRSAAFGGTAPPLIGRAPLSWAILADAALVDFSPDGRLVAWEQVEREVVPEGMTFSETWFSVVVADAETLEPIFRVRGASLRYGDWLTDSRWLANSSGFVVAIRPNDAGEGFAIVAADGSRLERLPVAPALESALSTPNTWYRSPEMFAPVPAPDDGGLLAYGRLSTYSLVTKTWVHANMTSEEGPKHLSPWASGGGELVFSPNHGGHGGGGGALLLAPRVELAPFDDALRFRVVVDTCLNLREEPDPDAAIMECLEPGTVVDLLSGPEVTGDRFSVSYHESGTYVLVGVPSGKWGWVANQYLEWV